MNRYIYIGTRLVRRPLTRADLPDPRQDGRIDRRRAQRRIVGAEAAALAQSRPRCGSGGPSPSADVGGASPVPVPMWQRRAQSRCRCGRGEPSPRCRCSRTASGPGARESLTVQSLFGNSRGVSGEWNSQPAVLPNVPAARVSAWMSPNVRTTALSTARPARRRTSPQSAARTHARTHSLT